MSLSITTPHLAIITNNTQTKKITLYQHSQSSLVKDKFLTRVLEQAITLNIDPTYILDYSTYIISEHTLKLNGNKLLIVNAETNSVNYDNNIILESSPNTYNFIHNNENYIVQILNGNFTLSKVGSSQIFFSETGVII